MLIHPLTEITKKELENSLLKNLPQVLERNFELPSNRLKECKIEALLQKAVTAIGNHRII